MRSTLGPWPSACSAIPWGARAQFAMPSREAAELLLERALYADELPLFLDRIAELEVARAERCALRLLDGDSSD